MDIMKSGIGSFVLRFAAMAVLIALATAAQAQGTSQSVCQYVGPRPVQAAACLQRGLLSSSTTTRPSGASGRACSQAHNGGTSETVPYDPVAEARKAELRATERQDRPGSNLCPPPYRMTAHDGCQK
jgi:hypothetical protein